MTEIGAISHQLGDVFAAMANDTGTAFSKTALGLFRKKRLKELFALRVSPVDYRDHVEFFKDYQVGEFLRKLDVDIGLDLVSEAEQLFTELEHLNLKTNLRLTRFVHNHSIEPSEARILPFIGQVRKIISKILGPIPRGLEMGFGKGSTFSDRTPLNTVPDKITSCPEFTDGVADFMTFFWESAWGRSLAERADFRESRVKGNRFTSVEKDALKRRGICVEPSVNVSFQLGIGKEIRKKLKLVLGLDLDKAQDLHREAARLYSEIGGTATVDLSNASDLVAYLLVKLLFPTDWFNLLDALRSPYTFIGGRWVRLEKFSSMGNGFTFELETLIFYAICQAVSDLKGLDYTYGDGIFVYGDDIIVNDSLVTDVLAAMRYFGLVPNERKTFVKGPFRESCGGDFFNGKAVRPRYQKKDPSTPEEWIGAANGIYSLRKVVGVELWDMIYKRSWHKALDNLPTPIRNLRGPEGYGDTVVHSDDASTYSLRLNPRDHQQKQIRVYRPVPLILKWVHWKPSVVLASALAGASSEGVTPRGAITGYKLAWAPYLG